MKEVKKVSTTYTFASITDTKSPTPNLSGKIDLYVAATPKPSQDGAVASQNVSRIKVVLERFYEMSPDECLDLLAQTVAGPEIKKAKSYAEMEQLLGDKLTFFFDAIAKGQMTYVWMEKRVFPYGVETDPQYVKELNAAHEDKKILFLTSFNKKVISDCSIKERHTASVIDSETINKRFAELKSDFKSQGASELLLTQVDQCRDAVLSKLIEIDWTENGRFPFFGKITDKKAMSVETFEAIQGTWKATQYQYSKVHGASSTSVDEPHFEFLARLIPRLNEMYKSQPAPFKNLTYEQGLFFQNAVITGKILFDWSSGKDSQEKYVIDNEFMKKMSAKDKKWLIPFLKAIVGKKK